MGEKHKETIAELLVFIDQMILKTEGIVVLKEPLLNEEYLILLRNHIEKLFVLNKIYRERDLNASKLANRVNTNTAYLSLVFNKYFNSTMPDFVNSLRVAEAKELLQKEDFDNYTLEGIGYYVGFNSKSSFYRVFRKQVGISPNMYKDIIRT